MRGMGQPNLGIVLNFDHCRPGHATAPADHAASRPQDAIFNRWFIEGITRGDLPRRGAGRPWPRTCPTDWQDDMAADRRSRSTGWG